MPFSATWMDLENVILSEVSQTGKGRYYMVSLIRGIKKKKTNESIDKTETESQTQKTILLVTKGEREGGRDKLVVWD